MKKILLVILSVALNVSAQNYIYVNGHSLSIIDADPIEPGQYTFQDFDYTEAGPVSSWIWPEGCTPDGNRVYFAYIKPGTDVPVVLVDVGYTVPIEDGTGVIGFEYFAFSGETWPQYREWSYGGESYVYQGNGDYFYGEYEGNYVHSGYVITAPLQDGYVYGIPPSSKFIELFGSAGMMANGQVWETIEGQPYFIQPLGITGNIGGFNFFNGGPPVSLDMPNGGILPINGCFGGILYQNGQPIGNCDGTQNDPLNPYNPPPVDNNGGCPDGFTFNLATGQCEPIQPPPPPPPPPPTDCPTGYHWDETLGSCVQDEQQGGGGNEGGGAAQGTSDGNAYFKGEYNFTLDWLPESWALAVDKGMRSAMGTNNNAKAFSNRLANLERSMKGNDPFAYDGDETTTNVNNQATNLYAGVTNWTGRLGQMSIFTNLTTNAILSVVTNISGSVSNASSFFLDKFREKLANPGSDVLELDMTASGVTYDLGKIDYDELNQQTNGFLDLFRNVCKCLFWVVGGLRACSIVSTGLSGVRE